MVIIILGSTDRWENSKRTKKIWKECDCPCLLKKLFFSLISDLPQAWSLNSLPYWVIELGRVLHNQLLLLNTWGLWNRSIRLMIATQVLKHIGSQNAIHLVWISSKINLARMLQKIPQGVTFDYVVLRICLPRYGWSLSNSVGQNREIKGDR